MNINIDRIKIEIDNNSHYADVAKLVDNSLFLKRVVLMRKKWNIDKLFEKYWDFYTYIWEQEGLREDEESWDEFSNDVEHIRYRMNRTPNYHIVIEYAIGLGVIPEGIYSPCYIERIRDHVNPEDEGMMCYAIVVTPGAVEEEVVQLYQQIQKEISISIEQQLDREKFEKAGPDELKLGPSYSMPKRERTNIRRDREYYWLRQKGLTYKQIATSETIDGRNPITEDGVRKAVDQYAAMIKKY